MKLSNRTTEALEPNNSGTNAITTDNAAAGGGNAGFPAAATASPAPVGSLSAELLRRDGLLRYGR